MFDGTLDTWNTTVVDLELKDYAKPFCSWPYPVTIVKESMFRKEIEILVSLGVTEESNDS